MRFRIAGAVTAVVLALAVTTAPALAQTIDENLTVLPTFSVVVTTPSVDYGSVSPGDASGWQFISGTIRSNAPVAMDFEAVDFSGPAVLDADIRYMCVTAYGGSDFLRTSDACGPASVVEAVSPTYSSSAPVDNDPWRLESSVTIPTGALAGSYSSQIELSFYNL